MTAQELLDPLFSFISELKFNYTHKCVHLYSFDQQSADDYKYEILVKTTCNGLELSDFQKRVKELSRNVEDDFEDHPQTLPTAIKLVNRKLEDLFRADNKYIGDATCDYDPIISKHQINPAKEPHFWESEVRDHHDSKLLNEETKFPQGLGYKDIEIVAIKYIEPIDKYYEWIRLKLIDLIGTLNSQATMLSNIPTTAIIPTSNRFKLKWTGSNSGLAYLLILLSGTTETNKTQFIEHPAYYTDFAKWVLESFHLRKDDNSIERLIKELKPFENNLGKNNKERLENLVSELKKLEKTINNN